MAGFTKLFSDIVDSSIWDESPETCKVWVTLLALCDADGYVRGSEGWLASKSRVSLGKTILALNTFQSPDIRSRNPKNDGKRIEKTENGWKILNYLEFRGVWDYSQKPSAVRMRRLRERHITSQGDGGRHLYASASDSNGKGCGENQQKISDEKELGRITTELNKYSPQNDYPKGSARWNRIGTLKERQATLRTKLGVIA